MRSFDRSPQPKGPTPFDPIAKTRRSDGAACAAPMLPRRSRRISPRDIAAARVLDNCMSAVMMGDSDEIEACMLDAENDTLLGEDFTTAEDGSKTFRF